MNLRKFGHDAWELLFTKSLHISGLLLLLLAIIDISNVNDWTFNEWGLVEFPLGKIIYYLTIGLTALFGWISYDTAESVATLTKDVKEKGQKIVDLETNVSERVKEMNELFKSYLKLLVETLEFDHTSRISVYKVYEDKFLLMGRSSANPMLETSTRNSYPIDQGFIGKAWAEGEYYVNDLPDPASKNRETYYTKVNQLCKINKDVVLNMNMASRCYYIQRINGYENEPRAIIVLESKEPNAFSKEVVIEPLKIVKDTLVMFIEKNNGVYVANNLNLGL